METIEHLPKIHGGKLLDELHRVVSTVIVSAPFSFFKQPKRHFEHNSFQVHISHWMVEDFKKRGYKVRGGGNLAMHKIAFPNPKLTCRFPSFHQFLLAKKKVRP